MADKATLLQGSAELKAAATRAYEDFTSGKITEAEFSTVMESCEKESDRQGVQYKARQRANQFNTSIEESGDAPKEVPAGIKQYHAEYERVFKAATPQGKQRASANFNFGFKNAFDVGLKTQGVAGLTGENASGTSSGSALSGGQYFLGGTVGPAIEPEFIPGVVEMRFFPTVLESLFPSLPVSSPVVTYVTESGWTNNAAAVGEGATKPTSSFGFLRKTEQVGKVANLARITDEAIQDAAYVWGLIQRRLVMGVQRQSEVELFAGAGYPGVNGLLGRSTSFTIPQSVSALTSLPIPPNIGGPFGTGMNAETISSVTPGRKIPNLTTSSSAPGGNDIALGILSMITDLRTLTFFEPDAIVVNPVDWQTIRTATDQNGQYFGGSFFGRDYGYPNDAGSLTGGGVDTFGLWGKRLVTTPVIPPGLVLVGDFADAGSVLRLGGLRVDITNTNGTDFEENLWTARAEARVGLLVERPYLFELGVLTTSGTWSS